MAIKLNHAGLDHAQYLIKNGLEVEHHPCNWKEHAPTQDEVAKFLETHYTSEYGLWFLAEDTDIPSNNKDRYLYPVGDLKILHLTAITDSEKQANRAGHTEIANAARQLVNAINHRKP
jgi:hypothetical protein